MPYNITIDDFSPLISYVGQWSDSYKLAGDPYTSRYWRESFHSSQTAGSQASFKFNGTAVYIFGAKRGNHGHYIVTIDGEARRFDGYAPTQPDGTDGVYQPLFAQTGLLNGLHTITLTNDGESDVGRPYVDIDFVTWTSNDIDTSNKIIGDGSFNYTSPGAQWDTSSSYVGDYYSGTIHTTNIGGAATFLSFEGTGFYLYGSTSADHGTYRVLVDDHTPVTLNGFTKDYHPRQLLYYADGLGDGIHNLTVTNLQDGRSLDIDYVNLIQSLPASPYNLGGVSKVPAIVGGVCGAAIWIPWAVAAVWYFMLRNGRRSEPTGFLDAGSKPSVEYGIAYTDAGIDTATYATHSNRPPDSYPLMMYPPSSASRPDGSVTLASGSSTYDHPPGQPRSTSR